MGADNCYRYDKDSKKKTEEVEALKLHLGSMKIGNSVGTSEDGALCGGRTRRTSICPLCAERKLSGISGKDYL